LKALRANNYKVELNKSINIESEVNKMNCPSQIRFQKPTMKPVLNGTASISTIPCTYQKILERYLRGHCASFFGGPSVFLHFRA
jgi:hypothetical protein